MGRRTTFAPEIENELIKCAENGMTQQDAAAFVKMPPSTLSKWLKRGREAKSGKMHNFYLRWQEATVKFKYYYFNLIKDAVYPIVKYSVLLIQTAHITGYILIIYLMKILVRIISVLGSSKLKIIHI